MKMIQRITMTIVLNVFSMTNAGIIGFNFRMELIIVLLLIILNGVFAMAEIAIVSARKTKLEQDSNNGNKSAQIALELAKSPNRFLSTIQIGITVTGILAGVFGGSSIAANLSAILSRIAIFNLYSDAISILIVVTLITYLTLVLGELVPKRIALHNPEKIAVLVARPMNRLSEMSGPLVSFLGASTDKVLKIFGFKAAKPSHVTDEEVQMLLREGIESGAFKMEEKDIVERTLQLGDKKANALMTPRKEIVWLNIDSPFKTIRAKIIKNPHMYFPVCKDSLDKTVGVVHTEVLLQDFLADKEIDLKKSMHKPLFIPENADGIKVLEMFKKSGVHMALVVDEYGVVQGLLSLTDVLEAIVGDIVAIDDNDDKAIVKRDDGSYLVDGITSIDVFKEYFKLPKLPGEAAGEFLTIGGFIMNYLDRIPVVGDSIEVFSLRIEVLDMDINRVDKVLINVLA